MIGYLLHTGGLHSSPACTMCHVLLLSSDGIPCESLTLDETTTLLRGPTGSTVDILVAPAGPAQLPPRRLQLERKPLPQPAVKVSCSACTELPHKRLPACLLLVAYAAASLPYS